MSSKIRTTHVGSLPRPEALVPFLRARHQHQPIDEAAFARRRAKPCSIAWRSRSRAASISSRTARWRRCLTPTTSRSGWWGSKALDVVAARKTPLRRFQSMHLQYPEFPDYSAARARMTGGPASAKPPVCTGALSYRDVRPVEGDLALLKKAAEKAKAPSCFMTAASPGVIAMFASETSHYATEDDYVFALAEAMKPEYAAIAKAGVTLQIDCPDLTLAKRMNYADGAVDPYRIIQRNIEAANIAIGDIPGERVRLHLCWGNYAGPHTDDLPVAELFPLLAKTKARALSFEAANPRHEHEWEVWRDSRLPDDMILIPGVIDSVTNFVEHPRLVGQRLRHFVDAVGAERVIAGADCGFGTFAASTPTVFPSIVWEKLRVLSEGAAMAGE